MSSTRQRRRAGWWVTGLTALVAVAACLLLFRPLRPGPPPGQPPAPPSLAVFPLDQRASGGVLGERAALYDPTPLFLPTEWNTNQRPLPPAVQRQPGQVFQPFASKLWFGEAELSLPIGRAQAGPGSPRDLLRAPSHDPFLGFGREDRELPPLAARPGYVEVRNAGTGEIVLARSLEGTLALGGSERDWQPAEFFVAVTEAGLLGGPPGAAVSEGEEADAFFRDYLAKSLHLGERLAPGVYRVVVGP